MTFFSMKFCIDQRQPVRPNECFRRAKSDWGARPSFFGTMRLFSEESFSKSVFRCSQSRKSGLPLLCASVSYLEWGTGLGRSGLFFCAPVALCFILQNTMFLYATVENKSGILAVNTFNDFLRIFVCW